MNITAHDWSKVDFAMHTSDSAVKEGSLFATILYNPYYFNLQSCISATPCMEQPARRSHNFPPGRGWHLRRPLAFSPGRRTETMEKGIVSTSTRGPEFCGRNEDSWGRHAYKRKHGHIAIRRLEAHQTDVPSVVEHDDCPPETSIGPSWRYASRELDRT